MERIIMNNLFLHAVSVLVLSVPSISQAAAVETEDFSELITPITWINNTGQDLVGMFIRSTHEAYEILKQAEPRNPQPDFTLRNLMSMKDETVKGFGPYKVAIFDEGKYIAHVSIFNIPMITGPTDIRITENPKRSKNFEVWYRSSQPIEGRQHALAVMEATHPRTGAKAPAWGGEIGSPGRYEFYRQIAEYLLTEPWKKAVRAKYYE